MNKDRPLIGSQKKLVTPKPTSKLGKKGVVGTVGKMKKK